MINSTTLPATLEAVASITGREIDPRGPEVRADCPLCGKDSTTSTKLRVSEGEHGGLFAWCYSCQAPSKSILRALGVNGNGVRPNTPRPPPKLKDRPLQGLLAAKKAFNNLRPLTWEEVERYLKAIRTPWWKGQVMYGSVDGRKAFHTRQAVPPDPGERKLGKRITMTGLKGHGWYPRKWMPRKRPPQGTPQFLTEGEADAARIADMGYEAWSAPGGAGRWKSLALNPLVNDALANGAPVVLIQDNDVQGLGWAEGIEPTLLAQRVKTYRPNPAQMPVGDSLADAPERLHEIVSAIRGVSNCAVPPTPPPTPYQDLVGTHTTAQFDTPLPTGVIPRMERPVDRRCKAGYARRGMAAADVNRGDPFARLTMPIDCRKCQLCLDWHIDEIALLWVSGNPMDGCQTIVRFFDLGTVDDVRKALHAQQRRKGGCKGQPAFHATIRWEHPAVDDDSAPTYTYDTVIWYRDQLPEDGVANTREWAVERGIRHEIEEGATVTRADFAEILMRSGLLFGDDGQGKRRWGRWKWPVKYARRKDPTYTMGDSAHRVHIPGEPGADYVSGTEEALQRLDIERKKPELGAAMNARDWMRRVVISKAQWMKMVEDVVEGQRPPTLEGYEGPTGLLRDAVWAWLYQKAPRAAYMEVWARIGATLELEEVEPAPPRPLSQIAVGLQRLGGRMAASDLEGGAVPLDVPVSEPIGVEDYDVWDDWDVAMPEWDDWELNWQPL